MGFKACNEFKIFKCTKLWKKSLKVSCNYMNFSRRKRKQYWTIIFFPYIVDLEATNKIKIKKSAKTLNIGPILNIVWLGGTRWTGSTSGTAFVYLVLVGAQWTFVREKKKEDKNSKLVLTVISGTRIRNLFDEKETSGWKAVWLNLNIFAKLFNLLSSSSQNKHRLNHFLNNELSAIRLIYVVAP